MTRTIYAELFFLWAWLVICVDWITSEYVTEKWAWDYKLKNIVKTVSHSPSEKKCL